jgi:DNA repair protein SbcC/Rad50
MMITKIILKNWRTHLDNEINFSEGTNCFVGHMGSGKTSVIDAVCFGLFGTFLQVQQKKLKLEDIIMKKPEVKDRAEVTLFFDIGDDNEWNVKRIITRGKTTAELRKNGELIEGPQPTKVNDEIEKLLKMNYDLFSRAVYSEQNQLDMFLTIPKGQRMKKIDELLAIDKFEKARLNTRALINRSGTVLGEKEDMIRDLEADESLRKIDNVRRDISDLREKGEKMARQLQDALIKKTEFTKDITNLKAQQKKMQGIEEDSKKYSALIELVESDLEKIKAELVEYAEITDGQLREGIAKNGEEMKVLQGSLLEEKENFQNLIKEYAEDNAKINLLEKERIPKLQELSKEQESVEERLRNNPIKKLKADYDKCKEELENSRMELQKAVAKLSELDESIKDLESVGSSCPICDSRMTEEKKEKLIDKKKKLSKELRKDVEKYTESIDGIKSALPGMEAKIRAVERLDDRLEDIKDSSRELKVLESDLKKLKSKSSVFENQKKMFEKNIGMIESNLNILKEKHDKMSQVVIKKEEADRKIDMVREYKQNLAFLESERGLLVSFSPSVLEKVESDYRSILGLEAELNANARNLQEMLSDKQSLLEEIENKKKMLESYMTETRKIAAISDQLRLLESALEATQEQLRKDFITSVNDAMQSIWTELYPYKDIYNIRLGIEEGDYVLQMQDSTGWVPADGVASGGERSLACLTLRIAFSLVLAPQIRMLVLDEPTANLDSNAIDILSDVLRERITRLVEQCFLVTHDDKLKEAVSGFCYEFSRDKSKDGVTNVTLVSSPTQV